MSNKAIFLDRDGTINVEKGYLYKTEEFEFMPDVFEALKMLQDLGYLLIIITNQSGIARGYYGEADFLYLTKWMLEKMRKEGIEIKDVFYCPHHPKGQCNCRKPAIGLFLQAIEKYNIDLSASYAIGDKIRDCAICGSTDCQGFLIGNNEKRRIIEDVKKGKYHHLSYQYRLLDCALNIGKRRLI